MSLLGDALGTAGGGGFDVGALAAKFGLSEEQVQKVLQALTKFTGQPGDTVEQAATETGVEKSKIEQVLSAVGGEGAISKLGGALGGGGLGKLLG